MGFLITSFPVNPLMNPYPASLDNSSLLSRGGRRPGVHCKFPLPQPGQLPGGGGGGGGGARGVPAGLGGEQGRGADGVQQALRESGLHHREVQQPGKVPLHGHQRDHQHHHQASAPTHHHHFPYRKYDLYYKSDRYDLVI